MKNFLPPVLLLAISLLWLRLEDITLYQVDAIVYSDIAKQLSVRPITEWSHLFWNGLPYYEHPPLMKWILALSIRLFGSTSLATVLPAVMFSTLSVLVTFLISKELINARYALVSAIILCLTPFFVRNGRNPMMEPPLTFFILLAVYFGILSIKSKRTAFALLSGIALSCGLLTKGPPALITVPALGWLTVYLKLEKKFLSRFVVIGLLGVIAPLIFFELWHHAIAGVYFLPNYYVAQIAPAATIPSPQSSDWLFYAKDALTRQWLWLPFVVASIVLVLRSGRRDPIVAFGTAIILWAGPIIAFSFFHKKSIWYADITAPGLAMLAGISAHAWADRQGRHHQIARTAYALGLLLLLLGSTVPSIFYYPRPIEEFFHHLSKHPGKPKLKEQKIADCLGLDPWKGPHFISYYLDAEMVSCQSASARYRLSADSTDNLFRRDSIALTEIRR